ncbi:MAG: hypothetical protein NVSMB67_28930 [Flavisolibacter sp.]
MVFLSLCTGLVICLTLLSCSKNSSSNGTTPVPPTGFDCSTVPSKFTADVFPIINGTCGVNGCHNAGSANGPGPLTNYAQISGDAANIRSAVVSKRMPKNATLTDVDIHKIMCWVDAGALNN